MREILSALDHYRMEISNISSFMLRAIGDMYHPSWIEADPVIRSKRIEHTINSIELAYRFGARTVSTGPEAPLTEWIASRRSVCFLDGLRQVESIARKRKVKVIIEPEPTL